MMMNPPPPLVSDLVLIGGGHAHVHVLKMLGMAEGRKLVMEQGIRVTLIARDIHTPYSGMLPGFVAGHYTFDEIHLDLQKLCQFSDIRLIHASAIKITYNQHSNSSSSSSSTGGGGGWIECDDGRPPIRYDALSIDIGSSPSGAPPDFVTPVKPIAHFARRFESLQSTIARKATSFSPDNNPFTLLVVGAGAGGIELALAVQFKLQQLLEEKGVPKTALKLVLATRGSTLLSQHKPGVRRIFARILKERNVQVRYDTEVTGVTLLGNGQKQTILSNNATPIVFDECLWCTSAGASRWMSQNTPFATTPDGFLRVDDCYQCVDHPGVFAAGDCCHMVDHPRPKAGVFAVRAGPPLRENLLRYLMQEPLVPHTPQTNFMGLISTGDQYAIGSKGSWWFPIEGKWVWEWKDSIDRKWMSMYQDLPDLEEMMAEMEFGPPSQSIPSAVQQKGPEVMAAFAAEAMRCGGCGAKVGATTVMRVLQSVHRRQKRRARELQLPQPQPIDHDDAAVIPIPKNSAGGAMIHTIDYFRSFLSDPFLFGKIAAVHALSDVHAMGATAQSALALAVVPFAADDEITESTLVDLLSGASDVFQDEHVRIVGGHTCEGAELACGFAIQGYTASPRKLLRKRGGKAGDRIVLTKPIGTGALFAADMRAKCVGRHVSEALASMVQSNIHASRTAQTTKGVHSCTDVTGFGLAGHLLEMLMAEVEEPVSAVLRIRKIPFLEGGLAASRDQIFSSLQPQNSRNRRAVSNHVAAAQSFPVEYPLLFDPQTAGGLLFFVDPSVCDAFVEELGAVYESTAVIGELEPYVEAPFENGGICTIGSAGIPTGLRIRIEE